MNKQERNMIAVLRNMACLMAESLYAIETGKDESGIIERLNDILNSCVSYKVAFHKRPLRLFL